MNYLAIDPGTHMGWALEVEGEVIGKGGKPDPTQAVPPLVASGVEDFSGSRHEGGGMRFLRFSQWLTGRLMGCGAVPLIDAVFYEKVCAHKGTDAAQIYGGFIAQLTATCEHWKIPYLGIPVGTIKKVATGKGKASKEAMIAAAREKWPEQDVDDDNQADALWILEAGKREIGG